MVACILSTVISSGSGVDVCAYVLPWELITTVKQDCVITVRLVLIDMADFTLMTAIASICLFRCLMAPANSYVCVVLVQPGGQFVKPFVTHFRDVWKPP